MAPPPWLPRRRIDFGKAWYARWANESPSTASSGRLVLAIPSLLRSDHLAVQNMCNRLKVEGMGVGPDPRHTRRAAPASPAPRGESLAVILLHGPTNLAPANRPLGACFVGLTRPGRSSSC